MTDRLSDAAVLARLHAAGVARGPVLYQQQTDLRGASLTKLVVAVVRLARERARTREGTHVGAALELRPYELWTAGGPWSPLTGRILRDPHAFAELVARCAPLGVDVDAAHLFANAGTVRVLRVDPFPPEPMEAR